MYGVINLGLKSIRLAILNGEGDLLYKTSLPLTTTVYADCVEQSADEWWEMTLKLFRKAEIAGVPLMDLKGLTVSASSSCLITVDETMRPLLPIIMVNDRRHETMEEKNTLPIMLQRIAWVEKNRPALYAKTRYFLSPNDLFALLLTGSAVTDSLNAEKMGFDTKSGRYPSALIDEELLTRLPAVSAPGTVVGTILPEIAALLRINDDASFFLATYDAMSAVVGSGALSPGQTTDVSGTVTSLRQVIDAPVSLPDKTLFCQRAPLGDTFLLGGSNNMGGSIIEWLKQTFYPTDKQVYDLIQAEARTIEPARSSLIFLPYLMGERAPLWDPYVRGTFYGLERTHRRPHFSRAIIEGCCFAAKTILEAIDRHSHTQGPIRLGGGLTRIDLVNQIKADIYARPVEVLLEYETTVMGAYLIAFREEVLDEGDLMEHLKRIIKVRQVIHPDSHKVKVYEAKYHVFKDIYLSVKEVYAKHYQRSKSLLKDDNSFLENL